MPCNSIGIRFARARISKISNSVRIVGLYYLWMDVISHGLRAMREDGIAGVSGVRERNAKPSSEGQPTLGIWIGR